MNCFPQDQSLSVYCCKCLGCVRGTLFRNKNTWSDDLERDVWRFDATLKDNKDMFKITF